MSWDERIKQAAYTSPGGNRFVFEYENVSRETDKKTTVFTFPDKEGAFIQDLGRGARRYPFVIFFSGADYDLQANKFYSALEEKGTGRLEHPVYGEKDVIPTGTIRQRDDLVKRANQAAIEVEFYETLIEVRLPLADTELTSETEQYLTDYSEKTAFQFGESELEILTSTELIDFKAKVENYLTEIKNELQIIADAESDIKSKFDSIALNILNNIDSLVSTPIELAEQIIEFLRLPSRTAVDITSKINSYLAAVDLIFQLSPTFSYDNRQINDYYLKKLITYTIVSAMWEATLYTDFITKSEVIDTIDRVENSFFAAVLYIDAARDFYELIDTGESYQEYINVGVTAGTRLVSLAFTLRQERIITLDKPHTLIDLIAELYADNPDNEIDNIINANRLNGDEILELPKGKEITYFL